MCIEIIERKNKKGKIPKYWDGKKAARIVKVLNDWFDKRERTPESIEESNIMIGTKIQYRLRNT